jgi:hypothetical protein
MNTDGSGNEAVFEWKDAPPRSVRSEGKQSPSTEKTTLDFFSNLCSFFLDVASPVFYSERVDLVQKEAMFWSRDEGRCRAIANCAGW